MCTWRILFTLLLLLTLSSARAQFGRTPTNGEEGIPGTIPNSYVISWRTLPEATGYEYVLSDNPLCFEGCAGDTRQAYVRDTLAIEFNLAPQRRYYWIIRTYLKDGDTTEWSLIYSFSTSQTDFERRMIQPAPSLVEDGVLRFRLDWAQNPRANTLDLTLISPGGQLLLSRRIQHAETLIRYQDLSWPLPQLGPGTYLVIATVSEAGGLRPITYRLKIQVR
ncbi:MAG: hypothetical protein AAF804_03160 [Bacteroidota bacterium]